MIIDAHQHVWDLDRADYPWLSASSGPLYRTFTMADFAEVRGQFGIDGSVLIQAADNDSDSRVMQDAARADPRILGIVSWAPLDMPELLPHHLERLSLDALNVGVRCLVHEREPGWLLGAGPRAGLDIVARCGFTYDFVASSALALTEVPRIRRQNPNLRIVIDHLGAPPVGGSRDDIDAWKRLLADAAVDDLTHAKISGLRPQGPNSARRIDLRPFVEFALDCFGPNRLMFGGDWPLSEFAGGYGTAVNELRDDLSSLSSSEVAAIMGGTAATFYNLKERGTT